MKSQFLLVSLLVSIFGCSSSNIQEKDEKINQLNENIAKLTSEKDSATVKVTELKDAIVVLTGEKSGLEATIRDQIAKASASAREVEVLKEENNKLRTDVSDLTTKLNEVRTEIVRRDREKELANEVRERAEAEKAESEMTRTRGLVPLTKWAKESNPNVRITFARWVVENKVELGYSLLVQLMADSDERVADASRNALSRDLDPQNLGLGAKAVPYILRAIADPTIVPLINADALIKFRRRASDAIVNIGAEAVDDIITAFEGEDELRDWAMNCTIRIGTPAKPRLQAVMIRNDIGPSVRAVIAAIEENEKAAGFGASAQSAGPDVVALTPPTSPVQNITVNIPAIQIPPTTVNVEPSPAPNIVVEVAAPKVPVVTTDRCGRVSVRN